MNALRAIVLGYIVRGPLGGLAWHHLQYVMGLAALGHDVHFFEDSGDEPACYHPLHDRMVADPGYGLRFAGHAFDRVGLGDCWAYYEAPAQRWHGPAAERALRVCRDADLVLNLSGVNPLRPWLNDVQARALVDTDPAFTQIHHLTDPEERAAAAVHTAFFTFGENVPAGRSSVPNDGFPWQPTRQPIVLDAWPVTPGRPEGRLTTVMTWDAYPELEYAGRRFGLKSHSFGPYLDLPARADASFELAVGSPSAPRTKLRRLGWRVRDPRPPTRDPWVYQRYLRRSKAEFGIAKHGYVISRSGWFSERSAAYLASGRPVLAQDTGFTDWLPTGAGLLPFSTPEEALAAIDELDRDYDAHCRAARALAEEHFDARRILPELVERAL